MPCVLEWRLLGQAATAAPRASRRSLPSFCLLWLVTHSVKQRTQRWLPCPTGTWTQRPCGQAGSEAWVRSGRYLDAASLRPGGFRGLGSLRPVPGRSVPAAGWVPRPGFAQ